MKYGEEDPWNPIALVIYAATAVGLWGIVFEPIVQKYLQDPDIRQAYGIDAFQERYSSQDYRPSDSSQDYRPSDSSQDYSQIPAYNPPQSGGSGGGEPVFPPPAPPPASLAAPLPDPPPAAIAVSNPPSELSGVDYTLSASRLNRILSLGGPDADGNFAYPVPFSDAFVYPPAPGTEQAVVQVSDGRIVTLFFQGDQVVSVR